MVFVRGLFVVVGVVAVLVGSQMAWGEVNAGEFTVPLEFFLDMSSIGVIVAVLGGVLGVAGLADGASRRSIGALTAVVGMLLALGAVVIVVLIDQAELQLDPAFFDVARSDVQVGPAGFTVAVGGVVLAIGGLLSALARADDLPPIPAGGVAGATPPGWYESQSGTLRYWTGTSWTHARHPRAT